MKTLIMLTLISASSFALTLEDKVFYQVFNSDEIGERFCGRNSELLVREWQRAGVDISKTEIWNVENKKFEYFGLVKYYQNRFTNFVSAPYKDNPHYSTNDSGGWHFHAFVVHNGKVYDSSYKREPTVIKLKDYILDMFNIKTSIGKHFYLKKDYGLEIMKGYFVEAYPAKQYLYFQDNNRSTKSIMSECGYITNFLTNRTNCI